MGYGTDTSTRDVKYIPSALQSYEHGVLKPLRVLDSLPDDSREIFYDNKIVRYLDRPVRYHPYRYPEFYRRVKVT